MSILGRHSLWTAPCATLLYRRRKKNATAATYVQPVENELKKDAFEKVDLQSLAVRFYCQYGGECQLDGAIKEQYFVTKIVLTYCEKKLFQ